ncbi:MAG: histidinol-phosphate transaminase [Clostridia bacterium]|nr:histidinol-phosphate transaminase [Clostridia bacterium]
MSKFFSKKYASLKPYTPGEQPKGRKYIKLNTNESPFPPPSAVTKAVKQASKSLHLYSDPDNTELVNLVAEKWGVKPCEVIATNGSDEVLNFAFMAFCDGDTPAAFPDITYGFYAVFADLHGDPYQAIPLKEDFSIDPKDYMGVGKTVFIANPNAPTGLHLSVAQIEEILRSNPDNVVVIDEAYVDFGGESCVPLIYKYDNLLVTQTFSKSRSLAGGRLGLGFGCAKLIADLQALRYSTNPYNVNKMTESAGVAALKSEEYYQKNVQTIIKNREYTKKALRKLGFTVLESKTNFLFIKTAKVDGFKLYEELKARGVLVRHFKGERTGAYNRVTIGTKAQTDAFLACVKEILKENEV